METKSQAEIEELEEQNLILHTKWGCDGASSQSEYMQKFSDPQLDIAASNLFMTSIVPLKMTLRENETKYVWNNFRPSSTRYCRALKFEFIKETPNVIQEEKIRVDSEIEGLHKTEVHVRGRIFNVKHTLYFTMIDGKVAQAVTNTASSSNCVICGATPSQMNDMLRLVNRRQSLNDEALKLGMSPLHARIRFMEYILHIAYNLSFKSWRTKKETTLAIKEETKRRIQTEFKDRVGIIVDVVKQGVGTTNNGNTFRRFLQIRV